MSHFSDTTLTGDKPLDDSDDALESASEVDVSPAKYGHYIVAIGTSAGGLEALKTFFDHLSPNFPHSFVIVQHLSPDYKSLMAELLAKNTEMPIHEVTDNMKVQPGHIYLIPPKKNITIKGGSLRTVNKPEGRNLNLPIDIFFQSLAKDQGEQSIGIVMTGTGSDGSRGIRAIKEAGGMVMVQDPDTAKFDGMPQIAVKTGCADYILPLDQMGQELLDYIAHPLLLAQPRILKNPDSFLDTEEGLSRILTHVQSVTGMECQKYKPPTLIRRIAHRMSVTKNSTIKDYLNYLITKPIEVQVLYREFLIGVTKFFRDSDVWEVLSNQILPKLLEEKIKEKESRAIPPQLIKTQDATVKLKIWVAGCSTGEEVYSMAILISELLEKMDSDLEVKIFATDVNKTGLEIASKGIYDESIAADISPERLEKYFIKRKGEYQVCNRLRRMVILSQHNVISDPPFSKMDIVLCRNLLIYLRSEVQKQVMDSFHFALNLNGLLILGSSETVGEHKIYLKEVDRKNRIYRNAQVSHRFKHGLPTGSLSGGLVTTHSTPRLTAESRMLRAMNDQLTDEISAAGVFVDEQYEVLHALGNFKSFVQLPDRDFSFNLLKILPKDLHIPVTSAIRRAAEDGQFTHRRIPVRFNDVVKIIRLTAQVYDAELPTGKQCYLITLIPQFEEVNQPAGEGYTSQDEHSDKDARIQELEGILKETQENLQATLEEVETSNEELQATNEELLAANEELQSTNEELQSMNEELHTVNAEHQLRIEDLANLNSDMSNLLASTDIGTIFLDREMRIRKFTPAMQQHFNLLASDINRPIKHLTNSFGDLDNEEFLFRAIKVLTTGEPNRREVKNENGQWYFMTMTPYIVENDHIEGVTVSFVEITELYEMQKLLEKSEYQYKSLFNDQTCMRCIVDVTTGNIVDCNDLLITRLKYEKTQLIGAHISRLVHADSWQDARRIPALFKQQDVVVEDEILLSTHDGEPISVTVYASILKDDDGQDILGTCYFQELTEIKETKQELQAKTEILEQVLEGAAAGYWDWMIQEGTEYLSPTFKGMFGYEDHEMENTPEAWQKVIHPDDLPGVFDLFEKHVASRGKVRFDNEVRYFHKDGSIIWVYCRGRVVAWDDTDPNDVKPIRMVGCHIDITHLKQIQETLEISNEELTQFAYVASHDLQEPLRTINSYVDLLEREYGDSLNDEARQYFAFISESASRMSNLTQELLEYSRIGHEQDKGPVSLNKIVSDVMDDMEATFSDSRAEILLDDLPTLQGYENELRLLFQNLFTNAIKFARKDVVPMITVKCRPCAGLFEMTVKDNGIGIEPKYQERVFQIFQRLHSRKKFEGTGIGLSVCKKVVELHGGQIEIISDPENKPEEGTTFKFTLAR